MDKSTKKKKENVKGEGWLERTVQFSEFSNNLYLFLSDGLVQSVITSHHPLTILNRSIKSDVLV